MTSIRALIDQACSEDIRSPEERAAVEEILDMIVNKLALAAEKKWPLPSKDKEVYLRVRQKIRLERQEDGIRSSEFIPE